MSNRQKTEQEFSKIFVNLKNSKNALDSGVFRGGQGAMAPPFAWTNFKKLIQNQKKIRGKSRKLFQSGLNSMR